MASLTAHLVETGDHGRLGFHPNCPVCRQERLFGTLSSEPLVSRRAQAALAGGVLAFSTAAPAAALGQVPDKQSEGTAAPEQPSGGELDSPGFDPGGETVLPFETGPAPTTPPGGVEHAPVDALPLETEPTVDPDARLVPQTEPEIPVTGQDAPVPTPGTDPNGDQATQFGRYPETAPVAPPAGEPGEAPNSSAPSDESQPAPGPTPPGRTQDKGSAQPPPARTKPPQVRVRPEGRHPRKPFGSPAPPSPSVSSTTTGNEQPVPVFDVGPSATSARNTLPADARFHVVAPGDSLWSIAKRLLGSDASAALIAREVNRLWSLNRDRIGTGDPDLLMVGTRLRLR